MKKLLLFSAIVAILFSACSPSKRIATSASTSLETLLADTALTNAHIGVYVYNPATQKVLYSHQSDKYFVPASNTKLFSCYAGMKYLGDSLVGLRYALMDDTLVQLMPTGDPTFFHEDYKINPVFSFLSTNNKQFKIDASNWKDEALGSGWSWNDYDELYMTERSPMPFAGNAMKVMATESKPGEPFKASASTSTFIDTKSKFLQDATLKTVQFKRDFSSNTFLVKGPGKGSKVEASIPFVTNGIESIIEILSTARFGFNIKKATNRSSEMVPRKWQIIHSQPTDSMLKPMMHYSDNFFAEQTLLMVSNEKLGYMNDDAIIDTLLKTDLKDLPQKPVWVDGSGLSRYNLFTPQCFVKLLEKMKDEFGMERIKNILPTGGEGTLSSLYKPIANQIFAKTGTLSGQVALSGYLFTKNKTLLMFSILVNNHNATASKVRKAVEKFIMDVWEKE